MEHATVDTVGVVVDPSHTGAVGIARVVVLGHTVLRHAQYVRDEELVVVLDDSLVGHVAGSGDP